MANDPPSDDEDDEVLGFTGPYPSQLADVLEQLRLGTGRNRRKIPSIAERIQETGDDGISALYLLGRLLAIEDALRLVIAGLPLVEQASALDKLTEMAAGAAIDAQASEDQSQQHLLIAYVQAMSSMGVK